MKTTAGRYARAGSSALLMLAVLFTSSSVVHAQWTAAGSTGTVDEADLSIFNFSSPWAFVPSTVPAPAALDLRYNVLRVDNLSFEGSGLTVRYRDIGASERVVLRLREQSITTGAITTRLTFDSDLYPPSSGYQVQTVSTCSPFFNFSNNVYWIEATLSKSQNSGVPILAGMKIAGTIC